MFILFYFLMYFQCIVKFLVWFLRFEASRVIWRMLSTKHMELRYVKAHKYEPFASRRSSGSRYLPYSNVDSFLKVSTTILFIFGMVI